MWAYLCVYIGNKKRDILILGKGLPGRLNDTALTSKTEHSINFIEHSINFT